MKSIFSDASLKRISSPEALDSFVRVSSPSVWIILAAIAIFFIGFFYFATTTILEVDIRTVGLQRNGVFTFYLSGYEIDDIDQSTVIEIEGREFQLSVISHRAQPVTSIDDEYIRSLHRDSHAVYRALLETDLEDGYYEATIVSDTISPIAFLFNN